MTQACVCGQEIYKYIFITARVASGDNLVQVDRRSLFSRIKFIGVLEGCVPYKPV